MVKTSAGFLMYRKRKELEFFLVHPGGSFWKNKDDGVWSIPKGKVDNLDNGELLKTAIREFKEETGIPVDEKTPFIDLGTIKQKSRKIVRAWAFEGDWSGLLISNYISIESPPRSGKFIKIPEVDKGAFFTAAIAKKKMNRAQSEFIERLEKIIKI